MKHFAVFTIPRSGLFFSGGEFMDGRQERVPWKRVIPIFRSHSAACAERDKLKEAWKHLGANFVVVGVELKYKDDAPTEIMGDEDGDEI